MCGGDQPNGTELAKQVEEFLDCDVVAIFQSVYPHSRLPPASSPSATAVLGQFDEP